MNDLYADMPPLVAEKFKALSARLSALEVALAWFPKGWIASGLTCQDQPVLSLARNSVTGDWTVWRSGAALGTGASPQAAIDDMEKNAGRTLGEFEGR